MKKHCFIHSGKGRSLCSRHRRAVIALAAKQKISRDAAVFELRDFELDLEDARHTRATEFRAAIRTIGDYLRLRESRLILDLESARALKALVETVRAIAPSKRARA